MKAILMLLFVLSLAIGAYAQEGMFGIGFGYDFAYVASQLMDMDPPLVVDSKTTDSAIFLCEESNDLEQVNLWLDDNRVIGWTIYFYESEYGMVQLLEEMIKLHGVDYEWDDDMGWYLWDLSPDKQVTLSLQYGDLVVDYYHIPEK